MNTSKKIISLLMCMLMVLSIVPMRVFAVEATEIDTIHVEGVLAPQYGDTVEDHFDDMIKKGDDGEFKVNGLGYYVCDLFDDMGFSLLDKDKKRLDKSEVIVEGIYYFAMDFLPSDGYVIPNDVAVTLDGALSVETEFDEDGWLTVWAKFEVKATEIDTVQIEGIPVPVYGQTVKEYNTVMYNGSMNGAHKINGSTRVDIDENIIYGDIELAEWEYYNSEKSSYLTSTEALPSVYYLVHWLYPAAGYKFPDDVAVTVDGAVSVETELDEDGCLAVWAEFEVKPTEIGTIHIEGIPVPVYGQTVKEYNTVMYNGSMDGAHKINGSTRVDIDENIIYGDIELAEWDYYNSEKSSYLTSTDALPSVYYLVHWLYPAAGYKFPDDVDVTVDGAVSVETELDEDGCLAVWAKFEVKCPHTYESVITKATLTADGKIESKCSICGDVESTEVISKIKSVTLSAENYIYDGKNKTPKVTVKDADGKTLVKNTDYKLSVASKRSGIGRYTVKVTFIGNYSGTKSVYFYIKTGKPATVKSASQTTSSIKLSWSAVPGASGYTVYRYSPSKKAYVKAGTTEGTSFTVKSLYAGTKYTFRVVSYGKTTAGKVYDSDSYALLKTATKTKTPTLSKVTASSTKGKAVITHTNVSGETGYTVYYSTKKDSGFKKYANFKADTTTCNITKLTSGKTYYFKVRTYITTDSGYVYSAWSAVKSVKVK